VHLPLLVRFAILIAIFLVSGFVTWRHSCPGGKPPLVVTSTKSHGGKGTIIEFAAGVTPKLSVSCEPTDWAFQKCFVAPGVVIVETARSMGNPFVQQPVADHQKLLEERTRLRQHAHLARL
jgi:hypothetical protein